MDMQDYEVHRQELEKKMEMARHSLLVSGKYAEVLKSGDIENCLHEGIKVILFLKEAKKKELFGDIDEKLGSLTEENKKRMTFEEKIKFLWRGLLWVHNWDLDKVDEVEWNIYLWDKITNYEDSCLVDGKEARQPACYLWSSETFYNGSIEMFARECKSFNAEQYWVEHACTSIHKDELSYEMYIENIEKIQDDILKPEIIVKASAGTGKTTVMIDRVMFLLNTDQAEPKDIIMVTFTQEAAKNMREKIIEKLSDYYSITGNKKYFEWMEQCCDMKISTIHSFFKDVIMSESYSLGYGTGITVSNVRKIKQDIIRQVINENYGSEYFLVGFQSS